MNGHRKTLGHWLRLRQAAFWAVFLFVLTQGATLHAELPKTSFPALFSSKQKSPVLYRFSDHLAQSSTFIHTKENGQEQWLRGEWQGDRFYFQGLDPEAEVQKEPMQGKEGQQGIRFHPLVKGTRTIEFREVPAGTRMMIYYEAQPLEPSGKTRQANYIYFDVKIGSHGIERIHIPLEKGFKKHALTLGVATFLKRPVTVHFEVMAERPENVSFHFDAEII